MKRVLMIAYHFPPFAGSSGVQRALRFASHLFGFGWEPIVLSVHTRAYETCSNDLLASLPSDLRVIRAPAWDAKRHLGIQGRYPAFLARPDRWRSWWLGAVPLGALAIRRYSLDAIWSTYPIATAHSIGASLARLSHLPWVADFRDPMAQDDYPPDPAIRRSYAKLERTVVSKAGVCTFTTPSAVRLYRERYPDHGAGFTLLENGYDEDTFSQSAMSNEPLNPGRLTILHSGVVYPRERDPTCLFAALADLRARSPDLFARLVVRFRAPQHDEMLHNLARSYLLEEHVELSPPVSYAGAATEMCRADGLLILQANSCNAQIPAKFYEYLRARRPMLVLAAGDTAAAASAAGIPASAPLDDALRIRELFEKFLDSPALYAPTPAAIARASRYERTRELARILDGVAVT